MNKKLDILEIVNESSKIDFESEVNNGKDIQIVYNPFTKIITLTIDNKVIEPQEFHFVSVKGNSSEIKIRFKTIKQLINGNHIVQWNDIYIGNPLVVLNAKIKDLQDCSGIGN
jgi:hypothetical protein